LRIVGIFLPPLESPPKISPLLGVAQIGQVLNCVPAFFVYNRPVPLWLLRDAFSLFPPWHPTSKTGLFCITRSLFWPRPYLEGSTLIYLVDLLPLLTISPMGTFFPDHCRSLVPRSFVKNIDGGFLWIQWHQLLGRRFLCFEVLRFSTFFCYRNWLQSLIFSLFLPLKRLFFPEPR